MSSGIYNEIAILLFLCVVLGVVAIRLRQPLMLVFMVVGALSGPAILHLDSAAREIDLLASIGVTLLLFIVGLKLDLSVLRVLGPSVLITGLGQVLLTMAGGYLLALLLGYAHVSSLYIAMMLSFSSTIVIVKLLSDKGEIDSLYGSMSVGILIVQDVLAIFAIIILSSVHLDDNYGSDLIGEILSLILKGIGLLAMIGLLMRYVLPKVVDYLAESREMLVLSAISWAVILAALSDVMGFSKEVGGFLAGVSLASSRYRDAMTPRLEVLRNFLLLFFFLALGAKLQVAILTVNIVPLIVLSIFVLLGKPVIVMLLMGLQGYRVRTGFLTGITLAQISEFSLILVMLGVDLGHIAPDLIGLMALIGLVTIMMSSFMIVNSYSIYEVFANWLSVFERRTHFREDDYRNQNGVDADVVIFGFGRYGTHMADALCDDGFKVTAVDFDPQKVKRTSDRDIYIRYGDAGDIDFIKALPLLNVKWVVSTISHIDANLSLIEALKEKGYAGKIAISAHHDRDEAILKKQKVDLILVPYKDTSQRAAQHIARSLRKI